MAEINSLEALQLRKQLLIARSELQRQTLAMEFARIRDATAWIPTTAKWAGTVRPWLLLAAPVVGFWMAKHWRSVGPLATKALLVWRLYRRIRLMLNPAT